jgi:hypothetical protein
MTANERDGVEGATAGLRGRGGPGARAWPAKRAGAGSAATAARQARARGWRRGRRVAGGEDGRGVGGERGQRRRERVSVSEREKKEKPSDWLSSCSLPSARDAALDKDFFYFLNMVCRVPDRRHSAKAPSLPRATQGHSTKINLHCFAECHPGALDKAYFVECQPVDTRQSVFLFFCFGHQTFCGMFLHYVDLHVSFWDNYNSFCNN